MRTPIRGRLTRTLRATTVMIAWTGAAWSQDVNPSDVDSANAPEFIGDWVLDVDFGGNPLEVQLEVIDVDGKLAAVVLSPQQPDPIPATDLVRTDSGIDVVFPIDFGGQTVDLTLSLEHRISGKLSDASGQISATVEGARAADASPGAAAAMTPSELDTSAMGSYIGSWDLAMNVGGRDATVAVQFLDYEGKAAALVQTQFNPEPVSVSKITMSDEGVRLSFELSLRGQTAPVEIWITRAAEELAGEFSVMGGALKAEFIGTRTETDLVAKLPSADELTRRRSRGGGTRQAEVMIDGSALRIRYTALKEDSPAAETLAKLEDGEVFTYSDGRTMKLFTDADLVFGDTILKTGNASPDYPGVYGLWLKKTGDGWALVANQHADILGSQYDDSADVTEIPLATSTVEKPAGAFAIEIEPHDGGGVLRLTYGPHVWEAPFTLGGRTIAKATP